MKTPFKAGDILIGNDGKVTKILVVDDSEDGTTTNAVHVRFYQGEYENADAVLEAIKGKGKKLGWLIGHAPLAGDGVDENTHSVVMNEPVTDDELEGYRVYLEAMNTSLPSAKSAKDKDKEGGFFARFWKTFGGNA